MRLFLAAQVKQQKQNECLLNYKSSKSQDYYFFIIICFKKLVKNLMELGDDKFVDFTAIDILPHYNAIC